MYALHGLLRSLKFNICANILQHLAEFAENLFADDVAAKTITTNRIYIDDAQHALLILLDLMDARDSHKF